MNKFESNRMLFNGIEKNDRYQVKKALEFGANINERNSNHLTPLHLASSKGNVEIAHLLITMGADVNLETYSNGGWTALDFALSNANERLIEILIDKTLNVNSALLFYMSNSYRINLKIVRLLIEKGANVNVMDTNGWTPLHWALKRGYDMGVKLLLSHNADVHIKNKMGMTALDFAKFNKSYEIRRIIKKISKDRGIVTEISNNNKNTYGMDNKRKLYVLVGLSFAFIYTLHLVYYKSYQNHKSFIKLKELEVANLSLDEKINILVESKVNVDVKDEYGKSRLHWATIETNLDFAKLLIEAGADVNSKDKEGNAPLHIATRQNNFEIAKLLLAHGADVDAKDNWGDSPLHYAHSQEMKTLLKKYRAIK